MYLLFDLEAVYHWSKLAQNLLGLLVILNLSCDEVGKVAQGFRGIKNLVRRGLATSRKSFFAEAGFRTFFMTPTASSV